jgi:hypothetical protein
MAGFGLSGVEILGCLTRELVHMYIFYETPVGQLISDVTICLQSSCK